jgi:dTDP-4-dehydrorhamnose 3,5-epimerase
MVEIQEEFFLSSVYLLIYKEKFDTRGSFSKVFDQTIYDNLNIKFSCKQVCISRNKFRGTIRGLHFQSIPFQEKKIIICNKGKILDVFVDIRPKSKTYLKHHSVILSEGDSKLLFLPKGFAHGFITLENNTEVLYLLDGKYNDAASDGLRWNDPKLNIDWKIKPKTISKKDESYKLL